MGRSMSLESTQMALAAFEYTLLFSGAGFLLWLGFSRWQRQRWLEANHLAYWQVSLSGFALCASFVLLGAFFGQVLVSAIFNSLVQSGTDRAGKELLVYGSGAHGGALVACLLCPALLERVAFNPAAGQPPRGAPALGATDTLRYAGGMLLVAFPVLTVLSLGWNQVLRAAGLPDTPQNIVEILAQTKSSAVVAGAVLVACVLAPVTEELVFRAGLYRFIRQKIGRAPALLISGVVFGLLHGNWAGFLPLAVLGMLLALVYEATGSIRVSILAHGLFNLNSLLILLAGMGPS